MPLRISVGPDGARLIGDDGKPVSGVADTGEAHQAEAFALGAALAHAADASGVSVASPSLTYLLAQEIEAQRQSLLGVAPGESGIDYMIRNSTAAIAAEIQRGLGGGLEQSQALAQVDHAKSLKEAAVQGALALGGLRSGPKMPNIPRPQIALNHGPWQPRRPFAQGQKVTLDDDGFAILGNAVLATYLAQIPRRRRLMERVRSGSEPALLGKVETEKTMQEAGERTELRDLLDSEGVLDDALGDGPFSIHDDSGTESLNDVYRRWESALQSAESFAMVAIKDLAFQAEGVLPEGLRSALVTLSPGELRTPIARLGPCPITRELRSLVIGYFRGRRTEPQWLEAPAPKAGPRPGPAVARSKMAVKVLETIYLRDPAARLTKERAKALLAAHFPSNRAQDSIWREVHAPNWKPAGRPPSAQRWADLASIEAELQVALK
jgi:hypothetical protein